MKVEVYSGCERIELSLNGKSLGSQPTSRASRFTATFTVPYAPGTLKAVGFLADKPVAEWQWKTTGAPAAIRLTPDRKAIRADREDLSFVTVEVTDAEGLLQPNADHEIRLMVEGEGTIAAVGSGCPYSAEPYVGDRRKVWQGRCLVIVKSTGRPGAIRLTAEANGLTSADAILRAE